MSRGKRERDQALPSHQQPSPDLHRNHDRLQQDVASLNATVRKVEAEQIQLAGAINALANKFDALADRIAQLGKPNYQAAGFVAAILMAFGGLVWNFSWEQTKANTAAIERIVESRHTREVNDARFSGALDERLKGASEKFELWRTLALESKEDLADRMIESEKSIAKLDTDSTWRNAMLELQERMAELAKDVTLLQAHVKEEKP